MKIKVWVITYDDNSNGIGSSVHGTKAAAEAEFKVMITAAWNDYCDDDDQVMPVDAHEAYQWLENNVACFSAQFEIEEQEIDVPFPEYGPDIEAALCVWEWWQNRDRDDLWESVADGVGSGGMRMASVQAGQIVLTVHDLMEARGLEFTYSYDFDFVPAVCEQLDWAKLVEDNQYGDGSYRPDPAPLLDHMMRLNPNMFSNHWLDDAKREAVKQWAYADLVTDHEESIDRSENPAAWVKRIGEKYDLTPAKDW